MLQFEDLGRYNCL